MKLPLALKIWFKRKVSNMPVCTYCGGTEWYEGPSGGMSTNVLCANKECRHWFNYTPALGILDDLKRVEPTADEAAIKRAKQKAEADAARIKRYNDGRKAFEDGKPMGSLRTDYAYGGYSEASNNIDRICGFIDILAEQVRGTPRGFTITDDPDAIMGKVQR